MDLQERRQLDVAARMTRVRAKARPWRSIIALLIAIAGAIAAQSSAVAGASHFDLSHNRLHSLIWLCGLVALVVFGMIGAIGLSGRARSGLQPLIGQAHAGVISYVVVLVGVFAAQQSLANLFAGLVLLFASPFRVGDHVRFRAGALSGEIDGVVTNLSLTYVRLETAEGQMLLPNAQALAAAVLLVPEPLSAAAGQPRDGGAPAGSDDVGSTQSAAEAPPASESAA
jgi:small-conductance mechanosensitive channel